MSGLKAAGAGGSDDPAIRAVALHALTLVHDGCRLGLGSGRASAAFIDALAAKVKKDKLRVECVPTSEKSARQAKQLRIPLIDLTEDVILDLTVDGADEVAPNLDLIKGWGGALVRERIVAAASKQQVILAGPEKLVPALGARGRIPIEVIPIALGFVTRAARQLGLTPALRMDGAKPFVSDNGNLTLDCAPSAPLKPDDARKLDAALLATAGVVDTGMFLGTASIVLIGEADGTVRTMKRGEK